MKALFSYLRKKNGLTDGAFVAEFKTEEAAASFVASYAKDNQGTVSDQGAPRMVIKGKPVEKAWEVVEQQRNQMFFMIGL